MVTSEIIHFRIQQARQEEAGRLGLSGPAITAPHELIEARAAHGATGILRLVRQGRYEEAERLLELPDWGAEKGTEEACHTLME